MWMPSGVLMLSRTRVMNPARVNPKRTEMGSVSV